jgi:hypothetical protein
MSDTNDPGMLPLFYVDFNIIGHNLILLSQTDVINDRAGNQHTLYEGMPISVYCEDGDGEEDTFYADGYATRNTTTHFKHVKWCCRYNETGIYLK